MRGICSGIHSINLSIDGSSNSPLSIILGLENPIRINNEIMNSLLSLQKDINKNISQDFSKLKNIELDDNIKPLLGEMINNKDIQKMMSKPGLKEKITKNKDDPMSLLADPEIMNLMTQLASNLNINK